MSAYLPILLVSVFAVISFIIAMNRGAIPILASGIGLLAALVLSVFFLNILIVLKGNFEAFPLSWPTVLALIAVGLVIAMVFVRFVAKSLLLRFVGDNGSRLNWFEGFTGGCLSLFSVAVGTVFLFSGFRIAGTVEELNYTASLAREGVVEMGGKIPAYPRSVAWRDQIEDIPGVANVLDLVDPFGNRVYRNSAAMVMVASAPSLRAYFIRDQNIVELAYAGKFWDVSQDPSVADTQNAQDRLGLVFHRLVRQAASRDGVAEPLRKLQLRGYLEGFVDSLVPAPAFGEDTNS